jgi:hypothetical protein
MPTDHGVIPQEIKGNVKRLAESLQKGIEKLFLRLMPVARQEILSSLLCPYKYI